MVRPEAPTFLRRGWCVALFLCPVLAVAAEDSPAAHPGAYALTLSDVVQRVLDHNAAIQGKLLDYAISQRKYNAERGVFEPIAFGSASHEANLRQNSTVQAAQANGVAIFREVNNLFEGGVESLAPTGAQVRAGYTLGDLNNNIPSSLFATPVTTAQYQSFAGLSLTQPLLKNFGTANTMAQIRLAALSSKIAFQEYRRELMTAVGGAEATYWSLHLAQQQVRFFEESVQIAEKVLGDNRGRLEAGKGSEQEVLEAQAGVGLRLAKLNDARQKVAEATNRLISLYGETASADGRRIVLADSPALDAEAVGADDLRERAMRLNPDYLAQEEKIEQELVRLGYARNQRLFEVNLKGAYGLNGLGSTPSHSFDFVEHAGYPAWSVGLELKVPILGGVKGRNELAAARLQVTAAELALRALQTEIANGLDTARQKLDLAHSSADSYQAAVSYNQSLLDSALVRLEAGKVESRKVFEIEADLFDAKNSVVESLVRYKVAQLELELIEGAVLEDRKVDLTQEQLVAATNRLARSRHWDDGAYREAIKQAHASYPAEAH